MARKSRKPEFHGEPVCVDSLITLAAGYARLSVEDRDGEGNSIENQKNMIYSYAADHPELALVNIYVDEDKSGGTLNRPAFTKMLTDVDHGKVNCIIVKDFSRFSRNTIDAGYYIEKHFPSHEIRFISINDDYDSKYIVDQQGTILPLKFVLNEAYALDISKKVKAVWNMYMHMGRFVGGRPPYGYLKAMDDRYRLVVDPQTSVTVRQIFASATEGKSPSAIARLLNTAGVPTPSLQRFSEEMIDDIKIVSRFWRAGTITRILHSEVYTGRLVQGKTKAIDRRQYAVHPNDWIRAENTHEAIVSNELYEYVNRAALKTSSTSIKPSRKVTDKSYTPNIFKGKIYCAGCGSRLERKKNHQKYMYRCKTIYDAPGVCEGVQIDEDTLLAGVSDSLRQCSRAVANSVPFFANEKPNHALLVRRQVENDMENALLKERYEDFLDGKIDKQKFRDFQNEHRRRQLLRDQEVARTVTIQRNLAALKAEWQDLTDALDEFIQSGQLTQELVYTLIERVEIFGDGRVYVGIRHAEHIGAAMR